ncbi:hypothetical protein RBU49_10685 [Clostridium sp. MB40-C1]|uniref:hypothetical protein n=1 Tax=Clostridium sp. MB40-C1 TaxID=3070996 RepID=UPI0027E02523|nr:hypothetical protein [Clostridium sp. MB40-C1]WMJ79355.1 hypothetical protein RBU49_10685 [Clostridium sp. MB40-C1]
MKESSNLMKYKIDYNAFSKKDSIGAFKNVLKYNLKIMFNLNFISALVFAMLIPVITSLKLLDYKAIASIGEGYLSIIGIILVPFLANIENKNNIKEVIYIKKTSYMKTVLSRIVIIMIFMLLIIMSVMMLARAEGSVFKFWEITCGTWISAAFLGMIGFTVANLIDNISAAYLISFGYYIVEYMSKGKYTKDLYLFSLTKGSFSKGKYILLFILFIMIIFNLIIIKRKS